MMKKINISKIYILVFLITMLFVPTCVHASIDVTDENALKQALVNGETEINLENNIVLSNDVGTHGTRTVGLEVKGEGTITINGNGHSLSTSLIVAMEVRANTGKTVKVILNDITIIGAQRAVDTRSEGITLELNKTNLSVTETGNYQALTIGGSAGPITIDINDNCVIDGGKNGYGIITFNPVNMTIDDSTVKGYGAIYMKPEDSSQGSAGSVVTITKSTIEGNSDSSGSSDNFAAIVLSDSNIEMNIVDSVIKATNTGTALQTPFLISNSINQTADNKNAIIVEGNSKIIVDTITEAPLVGFYTPGSADIVIKAGVKTNIEIEDEFLESEAKIVVAEETGEITVVNKDNDDSNKTVNIDNDDSSKIESNNMIDDKEDTEDNIENPATGDNIWGIIVIAVISLLGLVSGIIYYKKRYN